MINFYLFVLLIPYVNGSNHAFHLTVTEISHNQQKQRLEVVQKIFLDDFEDALKQWSGQKVDIINPTDQVALTVLMGEYIAANFMLEADGELLAGSYLGAEMDGDVMYCYSSFEVAEIPDTIKVENTLLIEKFPDQANLVHVTLSDETKSLNLSKEETEGTLEF